METQTLPKTLPSEHDIALARETGRVLSTVLKTHTATQLIEFRDDQGTLRSVPIPTSVLRLLLEVLAEIGQGNAVSVTPIQAELTTQQAADLLNVSRPFLVQLLEKGEMPFHKIGTHRRVRYEDVRRYKKHIGATQGARRAGRASAGT